MNDFLNQIELCWRYAETHSRALIVDTNHAAFYDDFGVYFQPRDADASVYFNGAPFDEAARLSYRPAFGHLDAGRYALRWGTEARNHVEVNSGEKVTFDFEAAHGEDVLLHDQCGGGLLAIEALRRVVFTPRARGDILQRLSRRPGRYCALHVRNTDLQTDYKAFLATLSDAVRGQNVLVCSDDAAVIDYARAFFSDSAVFTINDIPDTAGAAIHLGKKDDQYENNIMAFSDLMAMALSDRLFVTQTSRGFLSGYSRLARSLNEEKDVCRALLGLTTPAF